MIRGQVTPRNEAVIPMQVLDLGGQAVDLEATIDTGFSGFLTLPSTLIASLQLPYDRTELYMLGDGSTVAIDLFRTTVVWDGRHRSTFVLATGSEPLIGMSMLRGYHLFVDVIDGGEVRIEARP